MTRFIHNPKSDVELLQLVVCDNPFLVPSGPERNATYSRLAEAFGRLVEYQITEESVRARLDRLVQAFKKQTLQELRGSGTAEDFGTRYVDTASTQLYFRRHTIVCSWSEKLPLLHSEQLLTDVVESFNNNTQPRKRKATGTTQAGHVLREMALNNMKQRKVQGELRRDSSTTR